jgi:hypothetical protein
MSVNESFEVSKGSGWSVVFWSRVERYSLYGPGGLNLSAQRYSECLARAAENKAVLDPVPFAAGKTPDGKSVSAKPTEKGIELDFESAATVQFSEVGECVQAAIAKTKPVPKKAFVPQ